MEEIQEIQEILVVPEIKQKKNYPRKPPKSPQYYNEYYHQHNEKVPCEFCGVLVGKRRMCKHIKSKGCQLVQSGNNDNQHQTVEKAPRNLEPPRIKQLITMEEKMFKILDSYFENLAQKRFKNDLRKKRFK